MPDQIRQLAAIMFSDIVGYTLLMGKNERMAMELVRRNKEIQKPLVEKYRGTWLKEMGDGAMSSFQTASDAISCSLEIQKQLQNDSQLVLRIGIHLGEIIVQDGDIYGDGVNIASRLESIADPGGIYISDAVQNAIRSITDIQVAYLGELQLKNVDYGIKTYALRGEGLPQPKDTSKKHLAGRFFAEVSRRKVHRAGLVYLAFTFACISVLPYLSFLTPYKTIIYGLLALGIPVALYLAWNFERSPEGFIRTTSKKSWENPYSDPKKKPFTGNLAIIILLAIILLVNVLPRQLNSSNTNIPTQKDGLSIAVMPFRNDSQDPQNIYFCNGMMEDVINQLSQIEGMRIPSATSMLYYRDNPKPYVDIINELGVSHLLEGSIRKLKDRALMTVTLIDADQNDQVWSNRYEMDLSVQGVWEVQFEVAQQIIQSLQLALSGDDTFKTESIPTNDYKAYDNYLKAKDLQRAWDIGINRKAIDLLLQAISIDSSFHLAIAELAQAYGHRAELSGGPWVDSTGYYAQKASQIDPVHPESLMALAYYKSLSGDVHSGLELYTQASETGYQSSNNYRGWCEWLLGNPEAAIHWAFENLENDPNNPIHYIDLSNATAALGLFDESKVCTNKALALRPEFTFAHENSVRNQIFQGNYQVALANAEEALNYYSSSAYSINKWFGLIYIKLGNYDLALDYLKGLSEEMIIPNMAVHAQITSYSGMVLEAHVLQHKGDSALAESIFRKTLKNILTTLNSKYPMRSNVLAGCYAGLGMSDEALRELKIGAGTGTFSYYYLSLSPTLDPIKNHPEYKEIMNNLKANTERMRKNVLAKGYFDEDFMK